jgi:hypothetical protein
MHDAGQHEAICRSGNSAERTPWNSGALWLGLGFLVLGLACRLHVYLLSFPIWRDEAALALNFVNRDFRGLLHELDNFQVAPLLFLWIEKAVYQYLGGSMPLLRLLPLAAGVAGLFLFWHLARLCLEPLPAALALGFLAAAQTPIHLASMVKPYSLDLCAATLLMMLAVRYRGAPERLGSLVVLTLVIPFVVALSYPAVFVAGAIALVLLPVVWRNGGRAGRCWFLAFHVLCLAAFAAQLRFVGRQGHDPALPTVEQYMAGFWQGGFFPRQPLPALHWLMQRHVGHLFSYPLAFNGGGLLGLLLALAGARALYRQGRLDVLGLCLFPLVLNLVAGMLRRYPYAADQRLEQHLAPGICLLLGAGIAEGIRCLTRGRGIAAATVASALALIALTCAGFDALHPYHDAEAAWARDIAQYLRRQLRGDDRIIIPCADRFTLNCLRWHLLPFARRLRLAGDIDVPRIAAARVWMIDQMLEAAPPQETPPARDPLRHLSEEERPYWHVRGYKRFLARQQASSMEQRVYYYCCDVHVLTSEPRP